MFNQSFTLFHKPFAAQQPFQILSGKTVTVVFELVSRFAGKLVAVIVCFVSPAIFFTEASRALGKTVRSKNLFVHLRE